MSDKELLEAAAKAAGYKEFDFLCYEDCGYLNVYDKRGLHYVWNPLENDGDAFRLMVDLGITVEYYDGFKEVWATHNNTWTTIEQPYGDSKAEATRIAIVRAAASERIEE